MAEGPRVRFDQFGIELEDGLLWLDARKPKPFGVITHAHGDHVGRHETVLCTPETAALVRKRSGPGSRFVEKRFGEETVVGDLTVTLLSAGHILGSAMVLVQSPRGSLLYTGDFRMEGGLTCPPAEPRRADVLITEATYGRSDLRHPPQAELRARMLEEARGAFGRKQVPVFLAYALGKAQEVMAASCEAGFSVAAHGSVWNLCGIYRAAGIKFPRSRKLSDRHRRDSVLVLPPRFRADPIVRDHAPLWVVAVTGWGGRAATDGIDAVVPLSDHADHDGILALVDAVRPSCVHVVHGYARELAGTLRERGYDARAVAGHSGPPETGAPGQFGLPLHGRGRPRPQQQG